MSFVCAFLLCALTILHLIFRCVCRGTFCQKCLLCRPQERLEEEERQLQADCATLREQALRWEERANSAEAGVRFYRLPCSFNFAYYGFKTIPILFFFF